MNDVDIHNELRRGSPSAASILIPVICGLLTVFLASAWVTYAERSAQDKVTGILAASTAVMLAITVMSLLVRSIHAKQDREHTAKGTEALHALLEQRYGVVTNQSVSSLEDDGVIIDRNGIPTRVVLVWNNDHFGLEVTAEQVAPIKREQVSTIS